MFKLNLNIEIQNQQAKGRHPKKNGIKSENGTIWGGGQKNY